VKPILYFNVSKDDKEAFLLLKSSDIPCEFRCPTLCLEGTPLLCHDYNKYVGLDEIKSFVVLNRERNVTTQSCKQPCSERLRHEASIS